MTARLRLALAVALLAALPASARADTQLAAEQIEPLELSADAGVVAWIGGTYTRPRLRLRDAAGTVRTLRIPLSRLGGLDVGTDPAGAPMLTFTRCPRRRCAPYQASLDGAVEPIAGLAARGCEIPAVARWHDVYAFVRRRLSGAAGRGCHRGLYVRSHGRVRRIAVPDLPSTAKLDVEGHDVVLLGSSVRSEPDRDVYGTELLLYSAGGREREAITMAQVSPEDEDETEGPRILSATLDGGSAYWLIERARALETTDYTLDLQPPGAGERRRAYADSYRATIAIDGGRLFYTTRSGAVMLADALPQFGPL